MKKAPTVLLCLSLGLAGCGFESRPQDAEKLPPGEGTQAEVVSVFMMAPSGWLLDIHDDGSGGVGFGSHVGDHASFAAGTFDFTDVSNSFSAVCSSDGTARTDFAVAFRRTGETSTTSKYFSDAELARRLFEQAIAAAVKTGNRVQELYQSRPPAPHILPDADGRAAEVREW